MNLSILLNLAPLLVLPPAATGPGGDNLRCSFFLTPEHRPAAATVLLATGRAETVRTGPGQVDLHASEGGHAGTGEPGPVYGQVFEVHRFSGADSARLAAAFAQRGSGRAVIVPWDYDASCRPSRWTTGAAWVPAAEAGTFVIRLRPDSLWVDGAPVFDAFVASREPYPLSRVHQNRAMVPPWLRTELSLTAEQYFDLVSALPTNEARELQPDSAWLRLLRWQAEHPELADRYPATLVEYQLAHEVRRIKTRRMVRGVRPPIAGTYSMSASFNAGPDRFFHMRTHATPDSEWPSGASSRRDPLDEAVLAGYLMAFSGSPSLETVPEGCEPGQPRAGWLHVVGPPTDDTARSEWRGWIDERSIARQFPGDTALAQFSREALTEGARSRAADDGPDAPARLWLDRDGVLRLEQTTRLEDGRTLSLRGVRVSTDTVACNR